MSAMAAGQHAFFTVRKYKYKSSYETHRIHSTNLKWTTGVPLANSDLIFLKFIVMRNITSATHKGLGESIGPES